MEGVTADLAEVGAKERTTVVIDDQAWIVPQRVAGGLEVGAEQGVFSGPVVLAEPADGLKGGFANEEVATWEVLNATEWALDEVTATEVSGDEG